MASKPGRLARVVKKLTSGPGIEYTRCWGCWAGKCASMYDVTCACCRAKHTGVR